MKRRDFVAAALAIAPASAATAFQVPVKEAEMPDLPDWWKKVSDMETETPIQMLFEQWGPLLAQYENLLDENSAVLVREQDRGNPKASAAESAHFHKSVEPVQDAFLKLEDQIMGAEPENFKDLAVQVIVASRCDGIGSEDGGQGLSNSARRLLSGEVA